MIFLLRNWKHALTILAAVAAIILFGLWRLEVAVVKGLKAENASLDEQIEIATLEINQCVSDKALTEKVSNDYQNAIASLRRERDRLRDNPACIPTEPTRPPAVSGDPTNKLSGGNGLRAEWLYDFAGRAEQDRLTGLACVEFIDKLYQSRGYN